MFDFDFTSIVVYCCVAIMFFTLPNSAIVPFYVVYIFGYYRKISQSLAYLTGLGLKYTYDALISLKRIEVKI